MQSIYFSINEGIVDKKVLLFEDAKMNFTTSKGTEFYDFGFDKTDNCNKPPIPIFASKLSWERLIKHNPNLAKDSNTRLLRVDPITGEPISYSKERLKEFYVAWKTDFFSGKQVLRDMDNDSSNIVVYTDKLLGRKIYVGMYVQIRANKIQVVLRDLGKVRTKDNPNEKETYASYCYHIPKLNRYINWCKIRSLEKFKERTELVSQSLMDFILNEGDFTERVLDNKLLNYTPKFNF